MQPDLTIITVVFNGEKVLEPTIQSVIQQTFDGWEYILIDGISQDQTLSIAQKYREHFNYLISEPDKGVYDAMNKGLKLAKGQYILFLNAGDELYSPNVLEKLFLDDNEVDLYYGETVILNKERKEIGTRTELTSRKLPHKLTKRDFLKGQVVSHQSFIPKRSLCTSYNLKYKCSADIDWQLDILTKSKKIIKSEVPIAKYLQGGISDTQLIRCWKERFIILSKHFNFAEVLISHFFFVLRFLKMGAYKRKN